MAWYYGTYSCGHDGRENIVGPTKNRQWIADRKFEGLCYECYQAKLEADRGNANKEAMEKAKEMELPELIGTEKQVAWANTIRQELIDYIQGEIDGEIAIDPEETMFSEPFSKALEYMISTKTKASWYIDERNKRKGYILDRLIEEMPSEEELTEKEIEKDIRIESTVYPENCQYQAPAEIVVQDDEIKVYFEKNDDFIEVVKGLRYKWKGVWKREINQLTGTAIDRAAELGNKLLNAGFPISILDADTRRRAIEANYEPECDRWVLHRVGGDYKGYLAITWYDKDDNLYDKARRLSGSKWSNPSVIVPAEHWQEVEEFADMMGFQFSESARQRIEEVKAIRENAMTVVPAEPIEIEYEDKLAEILESSKEVLEDLRDD